jgi:phage terminase small subunit
MPKQKPRKTSRPSRRDLLRYRKFAEFYLAFGSPTFQNCMASAIKAGYSASYAHGRAYQLLDRVGVQQEIKRIRDDRLKSSTIATPDEVLEALTTQVRVLPNELFNPDTKEPISPADMDRRLAQAIAGYKVRRRIIRGEKEGDDPSVEITYEFKLVDRQKALEMLGRWHGIWEKDNRQKVPTAPQALVAFPTGVMTLSEWQKQAEEILAQRDADKVCGDAGNKSQPAGTREGR